MKDKFDRIHCFLLKIRLKLHFSCTQRHNVWVTIYEIYAFHIRNGNVVLSNQPRQLFLIHAAPWSDNNDKDLSVKTINIYMLQTLAQCISIGWDKIMSWGRTKLKRIWAIGERSRTQGFHITHLAKMISRQVPLANLDVCLDNQCKYSMIQLSLRFISRHRLWLLEMTQIKIQV
jgi:hypothetical protein